MAELDVEKNRQEVRFLLTGYYLDLYKLGNQIEVVRQNIALTQKEIDQMKARREQGTVLQNDITRYEFQLQSLELTLTKLTDVSTIINHQLVTTLHLPEQTVIVPDKNELNTEIDALSAIAVQDTWQQTATDNNLGIRQATVATNLAEQKVKQAKAESLPSVAVVAENHLFGPYTQDLIPKDFAFNTWSPRLAAAERGIRMFGLCRASSSQMELAPALEIAMSARANMSVSSALAYSNCA